MTYASMKRALQQQGKQMQAMQAMILENQRLMMMMGMGAGVVAGGAVPTKLPRAAPGAALPLATVPPVADRGEMPYKARHELKKRLEKLSASDMTRALELADAPDGALDLKTLDTARLWALLDLCNAAGAAKPRGRQRKAA